MLSLYVGSLVLGGALLVASAVGFGKDVDAAGLHADPGPHADDFAHGADAAALFGLFKTLRFWTFFLASFGGTGLVTRLSGLTDLVGLPLALGIGVMIGSGAAWVMRALSVETTSSNVDTRSLAGREAEVLLAIPTHGTGKIRVAYQGQILDLPATAPEERAIARGDRVMVIAVVGGTAQVTPLTLPHPPREA